jgi:hypothetical protein
MWPLAAAAIAVAITFGALQEQVSRLRADVTDIQAVKPDVLKDQIDKQKQAEDRFQADVKDALKSIDQDMRRIDRDVARIIGSLHIDEAKP